MLAYRRFVIPILRNVSAGIDLSTTVIRATSPLDRVIGWLRVSKLAPHDGMWIQPCSAIHTIGMRTPIDVILLDRRSKVVALRPRVSPNRLWLSHRATASMIELGPGFLETATIAVGDQLALVDTHVRSVP